MTAFAPIGYIQSPYQEKFGTPRQANIVPAVEMSVRLVPPYNTPDAVRGLEAFSHIWLIFCFHQVPHHEGFTPLVRPPRLGGNDKVGVFACRSPFRPNPIGLSLVELVRIEITDGVVLHVRGGDFVDQTPVLDIKPYIPYADTADNPRAGFAQSTPEALPIQWQAKALQSLEDWCVLHGKTFSNWKIMIEQTLSQDPRPAYHTEASRIYGVSFGGLNIRFRVNGDYVDVCAVE